MAEFETTVTDVIKRTTGVKSFRFKATQQVDFKAGQFFFVTIKINGIDSTKPFSLSNSPTEKGYYEFTKRLTDSPYSQALDKLKPGDRAKLDMPHGEFIFSGEHKKIAFLSGGIGITPIRSICKYATDKKLRASIILLYSSRNQNEIVFKEDLDKIQATNKNMKVVHTVTEPIVAGSVWSGRTGYIDDKIIKEEIPDYRERVFYLCGPPKMVEGMLDILKNKLGISEENIVTENFSGY